jgi:hypothetical protein
VNASDDLRVGDVVDLDVAIIPFWDRSPPGTLVEARVTAVEEETVSVVILGEFLGIDIERSRFQVTDDEGGSDPALDPSRTAR